MWQRTRVFKNWFFHPLHWPYPVIGALLGLYLISTGVVFLLHKKEQNNKSYELYYRALDIRKRELANLKLSGAELFVWKPLFACKSLEQEGAGKKRTNAQEAPSKETSTLKKPASKKGALRKKKSSPGAAMTSSQPGQGECIETAFFFSEAGEKKGYRPGQEEEIFYTGEIAPPCLICHTKEEGKTITWKFQYPFVAPETTATMIWTSEDFSWFHLFFWLILFLYGWARYLSRRSGQGRYVAATILVEEEGALEEWLSSKAGKIFYRHFFYAEAGQNYLRGYASKKSFELLFKKITGGETPFENSGIRVGVVEYDSDDLSYEGVRIAQALANKAPSGTIVVEENILPEQQEALALRKAVWKRGETPVHFRIVEL